MKYYVEKINDEIITLGEIAYDEVPVPEQYTECTEAEYIKYNEIMEIKMFGTLEERGYKEKLNECRSIRAIEFNKFDIYKSNLNYGIVTETEQEKQEIILWYKTWLDLPQNMTLENYKTIEYPTTPEKIKAINI